VGRNSCRHIKTTVDAAGKMASTCGLKTRQDAGKSFSQLGGNEAPSNFDTLLPPGSLFRLKVAPCPPESLLSGLRMVLVHIRSRDIAHTMSTNNTSSNTAIMSTLDMGSTIGTSSMKDVPSRHHL